DSTTCHHCRTRTGLCLTSGNAAVTIGKTTASYITSRAGERPDLLSSLRALRGPDGRLQLGYWNEMAQDRDLRGVLWGRCSQTIGRDGLPTGRPRWRMVHPSRQRECMEQLRSQVCAQPARTHHGIVFLAGPGEVRPDDAVVRTAQPPVCLQHARAAAQQCPHLAGRPTGFWRTVSRYTE
ncbi:hypothetical protein, partial [Streptomyces sp. NPDC047009]|uniref:hypothetical protein n=1 Tax=Streptomyces sp. NPDC047009 TaxID=3154496 RepID=UPI0033FAA894